MTIRPTPADLLTLLRLALVPVLWVLALRGQSQAVAIGLIVAGITDVLDGPVARHSGRTTRFGSQLDSVADLLVMGSVVLWMTWLHPDFFTENAVPLLAWVGIGVAAMAVTLIRFGRLGDLHLYSAKAGGVVGYVFVIWLFLTGEYSSVFFTVTIGLAILGAAETLLVAATRDRIDGRIRSILGGPGGHR